MEFDGISLPAVLLQQVSRYPDRPYVTKEQTFTYRESEQIIRHMAILLPALNPQRKMVALNIPCHQQLLFAFWACMLAGMDVLLLPDLAAVTAWEQLPESGQIGPVLTGEEPLFRVDVAGTIPVLPDPLPDAGQRICFFSSGTTGKPKLIVNTHQQVLAALQSLYQLKGLHYLHNCSTAYITPPLYHSYGLSAMLEYTMMGAAIILPQDRSLLGPVKTLFRKEVAERIDSIEGVPYYYAQLAPLLPRLRLPRLQHIGFGGDRVDQSLISTLQQQFPEVSCSIRYGVTEIPSVVSIREFRYGEDADPQHITNWLPLYTLSIQTDGGEEVTGDTGILCISGSGPQQIVTGDVVRQTAIGYQLEGRSAAFFKYKGFRINPLRLEQVFNSLEGVVASRAYLAPGNKLTIEYEGAYEMDAAVAATHVLAYLPAYMVPDQMLYVSAIKRTATGKVVRQPV